LSQWGKQQDLRDVDRSLATGQITTERQWYITKSGQSMVLFPGPSEFVMGSPPFEPDRPEPFRTTEALHHVHIPRSFALATKEITLKQFQEFLRQRPQVKHEYNTRYSPTLDCPQMNVSWYDAARYCRWLSECEEIDESEMCYPPIEKIRDGMVLPKDYLTRTGYRLPTEAEWEMACRAGTVTVRYCGPSEKLLKRYACYKPFGDRTQPVASLKPNECGLFDTLGNAYEWCHGMHAAYLIGETSQDVEHDLTVTNSDARVLRGGSFSDNISNVRAADRRPRRTDDRNNIYGFRIARTYRPD
jgi:formylglycine-generating enzyme required for sulfatase activity